MRRGARRLTTRHSLPPAADDAARAVALSIVIPCYNEVGNLVMLLDRCRHAIGSRTDVEVILVDNGSSDDTPRVLPALLAAPRDSFARMVRVPTNIGYGHGVMAGVRVARGGAIAWTHADLQTDVADVTESFERWVRSANPQRTIVRGRRAGRPALDTLFTRIMSLISSAALGMWLHDINAQPKLFPRAFVAELSSPPDDFALDLYALYVAKRTGYTVLEHEVNFGKRIAGEAKGGASLKLKWRLSKRTFAYIGRLRASLRDRAS